MSTTTSPSLLTNLFYLGGSRLTVVCMNLVTTSFMARALDTHAFGTLSFSLSYVAYFIIVVGLGYDTLVTRDVAHDPSHTRRIVEGMLAVRGLLALLCTAGMGVGLLMLDRPAAVNAAVMVQTITLFSVALGLSSVFQGLQEMRVIALREFFTSLINMAATLLLIRSPDDVVLAAAIGCVTQLLMNFMILRQYARRFGFPRLRLPRRKDLTVAHQSLTFFWLGLMIAITYNFHFVLLGLLRSDQEVGFFAVGWKLFNFAIILPNLIAALFLPRIAQLRDFPQQRRAATVAYIQATLICTVPVTMLGEGMIPQIVTALFGQNYLPASRAVDLLLVNALLVGINVAFGTPLVALGRQKELLRAVMIGAIVGIGANLLLVPWYGIRGAAIATLVNELVVFAMLVPSRPDMPLRQVLGFGLRCIGAVMPALYLAHRLVNGPLQGQSALVSVLLAGSAGFVAYLLLLRLLGIHAWRVINDLRHLQ
jgi:O-antigen/teichoic acid export membrane protein